MHDLLLKKELALTMRKSAGFACAVTAPAAEGVAVDDHEEAVPEGLLLAHVRLHAIACLHFSARRWLALHRS